MRAALKFYIDGQWVDPVQPTPHEVFNPATEKPAGTINLGTEADVDLAVRAARGAFESYSRTSRDERIALLERVISEYKKRRADISHAITEEMGAPADFSETIQAGLGQIHLKVALDVLKDYPFQVTRPSALRVVREPIGVCGLITPWNWPSSRSLPRSAPRSLAGVL